MVALADRRCAVDRQSAVALGDRWCMVALVDHRRAVCGRRTSGYGHAFRPFERGRGRQPLFFSIFSCGTRGSFPVCFRHTKFWEAQNEKYVFATPLPISTRTTTTTPTMRPAALPPPRDGRRRSLNFLQQLYVGLRTRIFLLFLLSP